MGLDIRKLAEQRKAELEKRQKEAMGRWAPYIAVVEKFLAPQGRVLEEYQKANIAQCCDNLFDFYVLNKMGGMISEATTSDAIAFARQMLPTIPALLPSLVADHVSIVQAIDRPQAQVYFMNIKAATSKGSVTATDKIIDAKTGHGSSADARGYASDTVWAEANLAGTGAQTRTYTAAAFLPVISGSTIITNVTTTVGGMQALETFTVSAMGATTDTLLGSRGSTGVLTLATGVAVLDSGMGNTIDAATQASFRYRYNVESSVNASRIGGLDIEVVSENVDAMVFPLKINYNVFAAINLQKIHGMVLADEGMKFATQEIRFAIDQVVLDYVRSASLGAG